MEGPANPVWDGVVTLKPIIVLLISYYWMKIIMNYTELKISFNYFELFVVSIFCSWRSWSFFSWSRRPSLSSSSRRRLSLCRNRSSCHWPWFSLKHVKYFVFPKRNKRKSLANYGEEKPIQGVPTKNRLGFCLIFQQPNIGFSNRFFLLKTKIHTLVLNSQTFFSDVWEPRYLKNKIGFLITGFW